MNEGLVGGRRRLASLAHGRADARPRLGPGRAPGPAGIDVAVLDAPGVGAQRVAAPSPAGKVKLMRQAWFDWAKEKGYAW